MKTLILTLAIFSSVLTFSQNLRSPEEVKAFNKEFIRLINIERKKLNIDTLIECSSLSEQSMSWSKECLSKTYKHSSYKNIKGECMTLNLGKLSTTKSLLRAVNAFKASSQHWSILMDPNYKIIGVSEFFNYAYLSKLMNDSTDTYYGLVAIVTIQLK
jgi:uncharacterized protein YkwD